MNPCLEITPSLWEKLGTTVFNTARRRGEPRDQTKCEIPECSLDFNIHIPINPVSEITEVDK